MSLRTIREQGDPVLNKKAKEIKEMTPKIRKLIDDMKETMYDANGVGLAAPQVGMLKRIVVIDVSETQDQPIVMINPEIVESDGEQTGWEGCLSVPGMSFMLSAFIITLHVSEILVPKMRWQIQVRNTVSGHSKARAVRNSRTFSAAISRLSKLWQDRA